MIAACARGAHPLVHGPRAVLDDPLAWPHVGGAAEAIAAGARAAFGDVESLLATWVAARSRFAEDWLGESGAAQYVILGAGLDSFVWRQMSGIRVFEVDHPATQEWKRARLEALGIPVLRHLRPCSLVVSYAVPEDTWPDAVRAASNTFRAMATDAGEPPRTVFEPDRFAALLGHHRFTLVHDAGFHDVEPRCGLPALSIGGDRITLATKA